MAELAAANALYNEAQTELDASKADVVELEGLRQLKAEIVSREKAMASQISGQAKKLDELEVGARRCSHCTRVLYRLRHHAQHAPHLHTWHTQCSSRVLPLINIAFIPNTTPRMKAVHILMFSY